MSTYVIGDVQGCVIELEKLLHVIQFDEKNDTLWFTGDLVNRGPHSLEVLRFVKSLNEKQKIVLGNHDLHLLAVAFGVAKLKPQDTFTDILQAPDRHELIDWLRHCPLLQAEDSLGFVMVHAGLAPHWTLQTAKKLAHEVESVLQGYHPDIFLQQMYGNTPDRWNEQLVGMDRLRLITNYFTRMRFCDAEGSLDLTYKGEIKGKPAGLIPWFEVKDRANAHLKIIFGHWAALNGKTNTINVYPVDTGCVWGNCLTAMRLEDEKRFTVKCG